jgi:hypothetical protein
MADQPMIEFELERLRSRVDALESALVRRSRELRAIQRCVCERDLIIIARVVSGLPPLPTGPFDIASWSETPQLEPADVEQTLTDLWNSTVPAWSRCAP